ncbi:MAG: glutamate-1-semialdehyde 2,1-aminomutase [Myxococcales bacterium]|nr:glutamate-1-semialdehyde 2,1-aminomutase [Myxococcales bacterium]
MNSSSTYCRTQSDLLYDQAVGFIPGGVNSPVRAFKSVGGKPVYFQSASGADVIDVDGNHYVDFCLSWGPLILGHSDPAVIAAVTQIAPRGLTYGACHPAEVQMAQTLVAALPGAQMARLVSSGTEAVMTALRLARGATGRPLIVKFEGGYHGHADALLVKAGSGLITHADPGAEASSAGVPKEIAQLTVTLPFADLDAVRNLFALHGSRIAAIIIEPLPANNGLLVQTAEFLHGLRHVTTQHGALLIFDEVISGFRLHYGGYGALVGVQPDLTTLGKIVGGGLPLGAIVGPRRILELLAPVGPVYQAGTLSGNPLSIAAGLATLRTLQDPAVYRRLNHLGAYLEHKLLATGIEWLRGQRQGSVFWPYFAQGPLPTRADTIDPLAVARFNNLYHHVLQAGFYLPPSAYEVLFLSAAHTEAQLDGLVAALVCAARQMT